MNINKTVGSVNIRLDTNRLENNIKEAQRWLANSVLVDSTPYVPFSQGQLRRSGHVVEEGRAVEWNTPYAHYQYVGEIYGPNIPKYDADGNLVGYWSPPKKQPTGRPLTYGEPGTGKEWFEVAKRERLTDWIDGVKKIVGRD